MTFSSWFMLHKYLIGESQFVFVFFADSWNVSAVWRLSQVCRLHQCSVHLETNHQTTERLQQQCCCCQHHIQEWVFPGCDSELSSSILTWVTSIVVVSALLTLKDPWPGWARLMANICKRSNFGPRSFPSLLWNMETSSLFSVLFVLDQWSVGRVIKLLLWKFCGNVMLHVPPHMLLYCINGCCRVLQKELSKKCFHFRNGHPSALSVNILKCWKCLSYWLKLCGLCAVHQPTPSLEPTLLFHKTHRKYTLTSCFTIKLIQMFTFFSCVSCSYDANIRYHLVNIYSLFQWSPEAFPLWRWQVSLVQWTESVGLTLVGRDQSSMQLRTPTGQILNFTILQIFPFTYESKRMGIIVRVSAEILIHVIIIIQFILCYRFSLLCILKELYCFSVFP